MASRRAERRRACTGKVRHATHETAQGHAGKVRRLTGEHVLPYRCRFCKGWHVGHPPARVLQAIADRQRARGSR